MTTKSTVKPPVWFYIVSVIALLWNLLGAAAYLNQAFMTEEIKAALPESQRLLMESIPAWVTASFAVAVWAGVLGCIFLVLRKKWARPILVLSVLGAIVQNSYYFFATDASELFGAFQVIVMPVLVIVIGLLLVVLARHAIAKAWLN